MISGSRVTIAESICTSREKSLALEALRSGFLDRPLNDCCKLLTELWTDLRRTSVDIGDSIRLSERLVRIRVLSNASKHCRRNDAMSWGDRQHIQAT
jgi:hypothetical protein